METSHNSGGQSRAAAALKGKCIQEHGTNLFVQLLANETASAMQSRSHCFGMQVEQFRRLISWRGLRSRAQQRQHGRLEAVYRLPVRPASGFVVAPPFAPHRRNVCWNCLISESAPCRGSCKSCLAPLLSQASQRLIDDDPAEPRRQCRILLETRQSAQKR